VTAKASKTRPGLADGSHTLLVEDFLATSMACGNGKVAKYWTA
jgi:hypothetical protein